MTACLFVTEARNDNDLFRALGSMAVRCPLDHGDVVFFGVKDDGDPVRILVERKKIGDMVSSILGGRYLYQAQCAHESGFDVLCLIVEGVYRPSKDAGMVEVPRTRSMMTPGSLVPRVRRVWEPVQPGISYSRFDQYLTELDYLAGIIVKRSQDIRETVAIVKSLWANFQTPPSKHNSLHSIYSPPMGTVDLLARPGLVRRVVKELDGIGWERSRAVAEHFPTVRAVVEATAKDWMTIEGIGEKTARKAVASLNGGW